MGAKLSDIAYGLGRGMSSWGENLQIAKERAFRQKQYDDEKARQKTIDEAIAAIRELDRKAKEMEVAAMANAPTPAQIQAQGNRNNVANILSSLANPAEFSNAFKGVDFSQKDPLDVQMMMAEASKPKTISPAMVNGQTITPDLVKQMYNTYGQNRPANTPMVPFSDTYKTTEAVIQPGADFRTVGEVKNSEIRRERAMRLMFDWAKESGKGNLSMTPEVLGQLYSAAYGEALTEPELFDFVDRFNKVGVTPATKNEQAEAAINQMKTKTMITAALSGNKQAVYAAAKGMGVDADTANRYAQAAVWSSRFKVDENNRENWESAVKVYGETGIWNPPVSTPVETIDNPPLPPLPGLGAPKGNPPAQPQSMLGDAPRPTIPPKSVKSSGGSSGRKSSGRRSTGGASESNKGKVAYGVNVDKTAYDLKLTKQEWGKAASIGLSAEARANEPTNARLLIDRKNTKYWSKGDSGYSFTKAGKARVKELNARYGGSAATPSTPAPKTGAKVNKDIVNQIIEAYNALGRFPTQAERIQAFGHDYPKAFAEAQRIIKARKK